MIRRLVSNPPPAQLILGFWVPGTLISCNVAAVSVVNGASGGAAPSDVQALVDGTTANGYGGIMVWYGSVSNGFAYDAASDASNDANAASAQAFEDAKTSFGV